MAKRVEITVSEDVWVRLESARGHEPRASFVKRALEKALGTEEQVARPAVPSPPRASATEFVIDASVVAEAAAHPENAAAALGFSPEEEAAHAAAARAEVTRQFVPEPEPLDEGVEEPDYESGCPECGGPWFAGDSPGVRVCRGCRLIERVSK